jgi:hypothetical protein
LLDRTHRGSRFRHGRTRREYPTTTRAHLGPSASSGSLSSDDPSSSCARTGTDIGTGTCTGTDSRSVTTRFSRCCSPPCGRYTGPTSEFLLNQNDDAVAQRFYPNRKPSLYVMSDTHPPTSGSQPAASTVLMMLIDTCERQAPGRSRAGTYLV